MAFIPLSHWNRTSMQEKIGIKETHDLRIGSAYAVKQATPYERYRVSRMRVRMRLQLFTTTLLLMVASPFALPMLLLKLRNPDQISASFETIIPAAFVASIVAALTIAHARRLLVKSNVDVLYSGNDVFQDAKLWYISRISKYSGAMNFGCVAAYGAGCGSLLLEYYPTPTITFGIALSTVILVHTLLSMIPQIKTNTFFKRNVFSAVSNLRDAVSEKNVAALAPTL
ncbi:uncharacterized protein BT62DRAFT_996238 [Guyanagaster necrorhizus]|uniref:Uncharacterized protein n=1 Tax=Guyanagaster necrorhizus TaxID=856835 RepID=A0A9P7VL29_9AGAR|nr:uncharacterized protein BT62DRAFT_996238 [Guyanagaster necrorhizus MCA 3950]KAG7443098.1 hypothetical protein BT62DRAFT_996238 [Guyanagaster necrorhizus MCA 3950]